MDLRDTGDGNYRSYARLGHFNLLKTVELIKLAYLGLDELIGIMMVADNNLLIYLDGSVLNLTDTDTSHILIIIYGRDEDLGSRIGVSCGSRYIIENGIK